MVSLLRAWSFLLACEPPQPPRTTLSLAGAGGAPRGEGGSSCAVGSFFLLPPRGLMSRPGRSLSRARVASAVGFSCTCIASTISWCSSLIWSSSSCSAADSRSDASSCFCSSSVPDDASRRNCAATFWSRSAARLSPTFHHVRNSSKPTLPSPPVSSFESTSLKSSSDRSRPIALHSPRSSGPSMYSSPPACRSNIERAIPSVAVADFFLLSCFGGCSGGGLASGATAASLEPSKLPSDVRL